MIAPESGVRTGEFLVAVDVQASTRPNEVEGRVRLASLIDRAWLTPTARETVHRLDTDGVVAYLGSFSKALFPPLRVGFVVLLCLGILLVLTYALYKEYWKDVH